MAAKKIDLKTSKTGLSVTAFLNGIPDPDLRKDAKALLKLFKSVTGLKAKMWGPSIVGFGQYTYYRSNGDEGEFMATGFSPRKAGPSLYIMPGYQNYKPYLKKLGPHKLGKSCLYIKRLEDIDQNVLGEIILMGLQDLKKTHKTNF